MRRLNEWLGKGTQEALSCWIPARDNGGDMDICSRCCDRCDNRPILVILCQTVTDTNAHGADRATQKPDGS